jgi:hypothetical protein
MAVAPPTLTVEVDFLGNPSATYYDRHYNDDSVVSYWRLNSTSAFPDEHDGVNDGVVTNAPTLVTGALPYDSNQALSFNGTNEDAYVAESGTLYPPSFTLETWVKVISYPGSTRDLVGKRGSYFLQISSAGSILFKVKNDGTTATCSSNAPISTGVWHHLAGVYDAGSDTAYLYVDGILNQTETFTLGIEVNLQPLRWAAVPGTTAPTYQWTQTAAGTGPSVTCPGGAVNAGDLLIAHFAVTQDDTVTAEPSGWLQVAAANTGSPAKMARIYYKVATGSEPGSYTWTINAAHAYVIAVSRFSGVASLAPLANPGYGSSTASGTTHATGTHLPNIDNTMVLALFSADSNLTWTADSGTERYDVGDATAQASISMYSQTQATAAGIQVTGSSSGTATGTAFMLVLGGTGLTYTAVSLDDTSLWNRALNLAEVRGLYESRLAGVGAWSNVSADVRNLQTKAGRQYELSRMEAGTGSGTLKDLGRDYDPANAVGIHAPNVIPLRKIRAQATISAVTYPIMRDFVERWPSRWQGKELAEVDLTMVDGFEPLALADVTGTLASGLSGTQINEILDKAQWPSTDRAIDDGVFVMADQTFAVDTKALTEIQDIADSELGLFFIDAAGVATFHDSAHRWTQTRSITTQATFKDAVTLTDPAAQVSYVDLVPSFDKDNLINEWRVQTAHSVVATARDEVSASLYFRRSEFRSTRLDATADAQTQAVALLQQTAKPALRFDSLTVKPSTTFEWQTCLGLRISDRVTVVRSPVPSGGDTIITKDCFVEGISWSIAPGPMWVVSFQLSPVSSASYYDTIIRDGPVSYWRLDTAA